jgi:D-alanyl-D-alanine carboxypeptidase
MLKRLKSKRKLFWGGVIFLTPFLIISLLILIFPNFFAVKFHKISADIAYNYPGDWSYKLWSFSVRNDKFRNYMEDRGIEKDLINFSSENNPKNTGVTSSKLLQYAAKNDIEVELTNIKEIYYEQEVELVFIEEETTDENLPEGYFYMIEGSNGEIDYYNLRLEKESIYKLSAKILQSLETQRTPSKTQKNYKGSGNPDEIKMKIENNLVSTKQSILDGDYKKEGFDYDTTLFTNLEFRNLIVLQNNVQSNIDQEQGIKIGTVDIFFPTCNFFIRTNINYDYVNKKYLITNIEKIIQNACNGSEIFPETVQLGICDDCTYFAVDKTRKLPSSYKPTEIINFPEYEDINIDSRVHADLINLIALANSQGFNINITSAYRSFDKQVEVFDYWVKREISLYGYDQARAEKEANTFSARPGFSEHQLGTTVDLNSKDCNAFDGYCEQNELFWQWLKLNAHEFGFVQSYPQGKEPITGYITEPWHYRWLGKEKALEYKSQEGNLTLNQWLEKDI